MAAKISPRGAYISLEALLSSHLLCIAGFFAAGSFIFEESFFIYIALMLGHNSSFHGGVLYFRTSLFQFQLCHDCDTSGITCLFVG